MQNYIKFNVHVKQSLCSSVMAVRVAMVTCRYLRNGAISLSLVPIKLVMKPT